MECKCGYSGDGDHVCIDFYEETISELRGRLLLCDEKTDNEYIVKDDYVVVVKTDYQEAVPPIGEAIPEERPMTGSPLLVLAVSWPFILFRVFDFVDSMDIRRVTYRKCSADYAKYYYLNRQRAIAAGSDVDLEGKKRSLDMREFGHFSEEKPERETGLCPHCSKKMTRVMNDGSLGEWVLGCTDCQVKLIKTM
jgi:hypothetical protein